MLHVEFTFVFENTMGVGVKDFALFRYSPFLSLSVTTTLIHFCSCSSDPASITVYAYLRLLTTLPSILRPSNSSIALITKQIGEERPHIID